MKMDLIKKDSFILMDLVLLSMEWKDDDENYGFLNYNDAQFGDDVKFTLRPASADFLFHLKIYPEDGGNILFRNVGFSRNYTQNAVLFIVQAARTQNPRKWMKF